MITTIAGFETIEDLLDVNLEDPTEEAIAEGLPIAVEEWYVSIETWELGQEYISRRVFKTLEEAQEFCTNTVGAWKPQRIADHSYA
jgi:DNA phosphorothioation-dependent restriction protein DptG